ncbi:MAG: preprotein translocase subunit SecG [bacterium]|nr:preprotein translocase subunit SecG [bacterium]
MSFITILQVIAAIALIVVILLQNRGGGLGGIFGGGGGNVFSAKRGLEKTLYRATIAIAVIFVGLSIYNIMTF